MPVYYNISKCKAPAIVLDAKHPLYEEIASDLRNSRTWYKEGDQIQCINRSTIALLDLCGVVGLGRITKKNVSEWYYRVSWLKENKARSKYDFACAVWTDSEEGWDYIPFTIAHIEANIGLSTNWDNESRKSWLKRQGGQ